MSRVAAADLDAGFGGREVEFVVNDDDRSEAELAKAHRLADASPAFIHEGLRHQQRGAGHAQRSVRDQALGTGIGTDRGDGPRGDHTRSP